ncbi:MAG: flavin reductase [Slackia sp.]|nr:flavin reductase [Slackia sp.]
MAVDKKAFRNLSYGLYIVTAQSGDTRAGCVVNTFAQVTSSPVQASIAINKENATTAIIGESGMFEVGVLAQDAPMELIGRFGFHTSADTDKFADTRFALDAEGVPYVSEHVVAHFLVRVKETLDLGTHLLMVGEVAHAETLSDAEPMTYSYYHQVKGGKTPPKASSYEGDGAPADSAKASDEAASGAAPAGSSDPMDGSPAKYAWRCTICGHIEYVDELPDDFACPICGVGKALLERIEL